MPVCSMLDAAKTMFFSQHLIDFLSFGYKDINFIIITNSLKTTYQFISRWLFLYTFLEKKNYWKINGTIREILLNIPGHIYVYQWNISNSCCNTLVYYICILLIMGWEMCPPPNLYIEVQTPSTLECGLIWILPQTKKC